MSWFERLAALYDIRGDHIPLYHDLRQITAVADISSDGELVSISRADFSAVVPVTERSAARTSAVAPHPLFDSREYLLNLVPKKHDAYLWLLTEWAFSEYSCDELRAVCRCVSRGRIAGEFPERGITAFSVEGNPLWDNEKIQRLWIEFSRNQPRAEGLCAGTGRQAALAEIHPKRILPNAPAAKLISANADGRLIFSEDFSCAAEALSIGAESSMKAHRALSRLIAEEGAAVGSCVFAGFTEDGVPLDMRGLLYRGKVPSLPKTGVAVILALSAHSEGRISFSMYRELPCERLSEALSGINEPLVKAPSNKTQTARECIRRLDRLIAQTPPVPKG